MADGSHDFIEKNPSFKTEIIAKKQKKRGKLNFFMMLTESGNQYPMHLLSHNRYHSAIFEALRIGIASEWFMELNSHSQSNQCLILDPFIQWMNTHDTERTDENKYECLQDYDLYRKNQSGVKTGTVSRLKTIIINGLQSPNLSAAEIHYLELLLRLSKITPDREAIGYSLTRWFTQFDLRKTIGDSDFLKLESPRLLMSSFRVTVAVTLIFILESRYLWEQREKIQSSPFNPDAKRYIAMNKVILQAKGSFDEEGRPNDILTKLLMADLVIPRMHPVVENIIKNGELEQTQRRFKANQIWQYPQIFSSDFSETYSDIEELLAAWLISCLGVQTTDIEKLKTTNIAKEFNNNNRIILMQIKYYKGRSGNQKETDLMLGSDSWTRALEHYLNPISINEKLFKTKINKSINLPSINGSNYNSMVGMLMRIWNITELQDRLAKEFERAQTSNLFINAMRAVVKRKAECVQRQITCRNSSMVHVRPCLFKLSHIKTSAIHARSDRYREADLINHHSHTSETEKHHYLTDENKDWVNQCGRITRLVLHDLQNVVYQPSVNLIRKSVSERISKTRLTETLYLEARNVKELRPSQMEELNHDDSQDLIVSDSVDSALYFIHYIAQAELVFEKLNRLRPDFVERTMIVQIEWMTVMLSKMQSAKSAQTQYAVIKQYLPPIFSHLMESTA